MKRKIAAISMLLIHTQMTPALTTPESSTPSPVKLVSVSSDAEHMMAYIARVSNPTNQDNTNYAGLLKYCLKHGHWSVFEHATMTLEANTSLAIATQMLRHRSFTFQQFSQRYADVSSLTSTAPGTTPSSMFVRHKLRRQDTKNRQNSIDDIDPAKQEIWQQRIAQHHAQTTELYNQMLADGVAKECARFVLPQCSATRLYMTGNVRSWIHYIQSRTYEGAQAEHKEIAEHCKTIFMQQFPILAQALEWKA